MKKIIAIIALAFLASCTQINTPKEDMTTSGTEVQTETGAKTTSANDITADGVIKKLHYTLRDTNENGEILDTNVSESGTTTPTFDVTLGAGQVIPGFEKNIRDMKVGETKSFTVSPEDGYGAATRVITIDEREIAPEYSVTLTKEGITGKATLSHKISEIPAEVLKQIEGKKVGDTIEESDAMSVKITEITDEQYSFEITNKNAPFYGKEISEGLEVKNEGGIYTITKIDGDNVTVLVKDTTSPFYGKEFIAGASAKFNDAEIKIVSINKENNTIEVEAPNNHPLAGKTLYFTVTVEEVIFPNATNSSNETNEENESNTFKKPAEIESQQ